MSGPEKGNPIQTKFEREVGIRPAMSFEGIGVAIGLKKSMVHRIYNQALNKLIKRNKQKEVDS